MPGWLIRSLAVLLALLGLGFLFVQAERGRQQVTRWSAPNEVDVGKVFMKLDRCVEAALKREIPRGSAVTSDLGPSTSPVWSYALPAIAGPYLHVVKKPAPGVYLMKVYYVSQKPLPGLRCFAESHGFSRTV